jgi:hypothetical protein
MKMKKMKRRIQVMMKMSTRRRKMMKMSTRRRKMMKTMRKTLTMKRRRMLMKITAHIQVKLTNYQKILPNQIQ